LDAEHNARKFGNLTEVIQVVHVDIGMKSSGADRHGPRRGIWWRQFLTRFKRSKNAFSVEDCSNGMPFESITFA
jgi:hypothetical protein